MINRSIDDIRIKELNPATESGDLNKVKEIINNNKNVRPNSLTVAKAIISGNLELLDYFEQSFSITPANISTEDINFAIGKINNHEMLKRLLSYKGMRLSLNANTTFIVAKSGNIENLKLLLSVRFPRADSDTLYAAVNSKNIDCVKFLVEEYKIDGKLVITDYDEALSQAENLKLDEIVNYLKKKKIQLNQEIVFHDKYNDKEKVALTLPKSNLPKPTFLTKNEKIENELPVISLEKNNAEKKKSKILSLADLDVEAFSDAMQFDDESIRRLNMTCKKFAIYDYDYAAKKLIKSIIDADWQEAKEIAQKHPIAMFKHINIQYKNVREKYISPLKYAFKLYDSYSWRIFLDVILSIEESSKYKRIFLQHCNEQAVHISIESLNIAYNSYIHCIQTKTYLYMDDVKRERLVCDISIAQQNLPKHMLKELCSQHWTSNLATRFDSLYDFPEVALLVTPVSRAKDMELKLDDFYFEKNASQVLVRGSVGKNVRVYNEIYGIGPHVKENVHHDQYIFKALFEARKSQLANVIYLLQSELSAELSGKKEKIEFPSQPFSKKQEINKTKGEQVRSDFSSINQQSVVNDKSALYEELFDACKNLRPQDVERLLGKGLDPNCHDDEGNSPVFYAAANCDFDSVDHLCIAGANLNLQNRYHETPLIYVYSKYKDDSVYQLLLSKGANPYIHTVNGTIFEIAKKAYRTIELRVIEEWAMDNLEISKQYKIEIEKSKSNLSSKSTIVSKPFIGSPIHTAQVLAKNNEMVLDNSESDRANISLMQGHLEIIFQKKSDSSDWRLEVLNKNKPTDCQYSMIFSNKESINKIQKHLQENNISAFIEFIESKGQSAKKISQYLQQESKNFDLKTLKF